MLAAINGTEVLLILFVVVCVGGIPAGIAVARKRSPIGWFFIGVLCAVVFNLLLTKSALAPNLRLGLSIALAPGLLLVLPRGGSRKR
jgi:hypothetical protein